VPSRDGDMVSVKRADKLICRYSCETAIWYLVKRADEKDLPSRIRDDDMVSGQESRHDVVSSRMRDGDMVSG